MTRGIAGLEKYKTLDSRFRGNDRRRRIWIPHQVRNDGDGERIRQVSGKRAPAEVALVIGMRRGKVIRYEANGVTWSFSTLAKVAKTDKVSVDWLFLGK